MTTPETKTPPAAKTRATKKAICPDCGVTNTTHCKNNMHKCLSEECGTIWDVKAIPTRWTT
jgi:hypothetical protein